MRSQVTECQCKTTCNWTSSKPECFALNHFAAFQQQQLERPGQIEKQPKSVIYSTTQHTISTAMAATMATTTMAATMSEPAPTTTVSEMPTTTYFDDFTAQSSYASKPQRSPFFITIHKSSPIYLSMQYRNLQLVFLYK